MKQVLSVLMILLLCAGCSHKWVTVPLETTGKVTCAALSATGKVAAETVKAAGNVACAAIEHPDGAATAAALVP